MRSSNNLGPLYGKGDKTVKNRRQNEPEPPGWWDGKADKETSFPHGCSNVNVIAVSHQVHSLRHAFWDGSGWVLRGFRVEERGSKQPGHL